MTYRKPKSLKTFFAVLSLVMAVFVIVACSSPEPIKLELTKFDDNTTTNENMLTVKGTYNVATDIYYSLNGADSVNPTFADGKFQFDVVLKNGENTLTVTADEGPRGQIVRRTITYEAPVPDIVLTDLTSISTFVSDKNYAVKGTIDYADSLKYSLNGSNQADIDFKDGAFDFPVELRAGENVLEIFAQGPKKSAILARKLVLINEKDVYTGATAGADQSFVRPAVFGYGLTDAELTMNYHVFEFTAESTSYHVIFSEQNYDGFLLVYEGSFDPNNTFENLIAANDDLDFYDDDIQYATSRIKTELEAGKKYIIVTAACGDPEAGCGPNSGEFSNIISANASPPEPDFVLPEPDNSRFNITLRFANDLTTKYLTEAQKQVFIDAKNHWESVITADLENFGGEQPFPADQLFEDTGRVVGAIDDVLIDIRFAELNGPLGSAGPAFIRQEGDDAPLTVWGLMQFEINEFKKNGFFEEEQAYREVILHEMGHVLGIGTLWAATGNVDDNYIGSNPPTVSQGLPNPDYDPGFIGKKALEQYNILLKTKGKEAANAVPIANTGGPGNYNGHWRELVFDNELMTPYAGGLEVMSKMTAASIDDIGYTVDYSAGIIDAAYQLPPDRVPGKLSQTKPNQVAYTELEDFYPATGEAFKGEVTATIENVDLNLANVDDSTSGCEPSDFSNFTEGNIALIRRGTCVFVDKIRFAEEAGAVGVLIMNQGNSDSRKGVIGIPGSENIPVMGISYDLGVTLAGIQNVEIYMNTGVTAPQSSALATMALKYPEFEEVLQPRGGMLRDGTILKNGLF